MAKDIKIFIKDKEVALSWLRNVSLLDEEVLSTAKAAGNILEDLSNNGEGKVIDDLVLLGSKISQTGASIYNSMETICDTVKTTLKLSHDFEENAISSVESVTRILD